MHRTSSDWAPSPTLSPRTGRGRKSARGEREKKRDEGDPVRSARLNDPVRSARLKMECRRRRGAGRRRCRRRPCPRRGRPRRRSGRRRRSGHRHRRRRHHRRRGGSGAATAAPRKTTRSATTSVRSASGRPFRRRVCSCPRRRPTGPCQVLRAVLGRSPRTVTRCHSVRSCRTPDLSLKTSVVATRRLQSARLDGVYLSSGSGAQIPDQDDLVDASHRRPSF